MFNHYFVASSLPALYLDVKPELSFSELRILLATNLFENDYAKVQTMQRFYDIQNIRTLWKGGELDPHGTLDAPALEDALVSRTGLPSYVYTFLDAHEHTEDRIHHFPSLLVSYFTQEINRAAGFLRKYLMFEREWRLVLTGFRAKQLGRDLAAEMQYEDPNDDLVAQIVAQKDSKTFEPPDGYEDLKPLFEEHYRSPMALEKALCEYRFQKIEEMLGADVMSLDRVLGYTAELIVVEKWHALDQQKGMEMLEVVSSIKETKK